MNKKIAESRKLETEFDRVIFPLSISKNISDIGKFSFRKFFFVFRDAVKLFYQLIKKKYALVYFAISPYGFAFFKDAFYVSIVKTFSRSPIVFHLHGKGMGSYALKNNIYLSLYKWVFRNAHVICLSENLISDIRPFYRKNVFVVNNGIAEESELPDGKKDNPAVIFLFLSNFLIEKGILDLLDAISLIREKTFSVWFVGEESDLSQKDLQQIIKEKGIEEHCDVLGPKYGKDKWECLKSADIFVFPTYYNKECFPVVLLEAFQAGLPAISTLEGGIPDIIDNGKNGFLIRQRDVESLAEKMSWFINNRDKCQEMGKTARMKFDSAYTMEKFETNLLNILKSIAES